MTIYPIGYRVTWRTDIPKRPGAQVGVLAAPWPRFDAFPRVRWDGEQDARAELPECLEPPQKQASGRDAWKLRDAWKAGAR